MREIILKHTLDNDFLKKWQKFWDNSDNGHVFNSVVWFTTYRAVYEIKEFRIVIIEEDNKLILILPLVRESLYGVPVWCSPGGKFLDKSSLLVDKFDPTILRKLGNYLPTLGNIYLQELESEPINLLIKANKTYFKIDCSKSPYLPISADPLRFLSNKNHSQIRGILKKNKEAVSYKTFTGDIKALQKAFMLDKIGTKSGQGKATFGLKKDREFIKQLIIKMPQAVQIDFVYYNKIPVIYATGFIYKKTYQAFTTAFNGKYRFLRPGKLLTFFKIQKLQDEKFTLLDFSRGISALKHEFTELERVQYSLFCAKNIIIRWWWKLCNYVFYMVLENKILYGTYLAFKRLNF